MCSWTTNSERTIIMIDNNRRFSNKVRVTFLSGAIALTAVVVTFTQLAEGKGGQSSSTTEPPKVIVDNAPVKRDTKLTTSFAPVVKKVAPSVVNVFISSTPKD